MSANSNEYMASYMNRRYHSRRVEALALLGGCCVVCGTTEKLEFDHIDPSTKIFDVSKLNGVSKERYFDEISKCQLLCHEHHVEKSISERSVDHGEGITGKKNCRCELCGPLKREYEKRYRNRQ